MVFEVKNKTGTGHGKTYGPDMECRSGHIYVSSGTGQSGVPG